MRRRVVNCANCGSVLVGRFCCACGQEAEAPPRSAFRWIAGQVTTLIGYDSRLGRSFGALIARPGSLTEAYLGGRRTAHLTPLALYLLSAGAFFLLHSFRPLVSFDVKTRALAGGLGSMQVAGTLDSAEIAKLQAAGVSLDAFAERFQSAATALLPVFLLLSVLLFAGLLALLHRRAPAGSVTHAVLALHWGAIFMLVALVSRAVALAGVQAGAFRAVYSLAVLAWLVLALKRVYRIALPRAAVEGAVLLAAFYALLGLWLASVSSLALRLSLA